LHFDIEVVSINAAPPERVEGNLFAEIDTDGNGELNESELEAYFKSIHVEEVPDEMWEHEDKNGDRIITWEEFSGPKGIRNPMGDEL
jgi:Ca2+-binding EF-hand superfamily protein